MASWVEQQAEQFRRLAGQSIATWAATEVALRESGVGGLPAFTEAEVPFLQLLVLHIEMADGSMVCVRTYQADHEWGLCAGVPETALDDGLDGIYRTRHLRDLAVGAVLDVRVGMSESGNIRSVELSFEGASPVLLVAGEVHERPGGSLRFCLDDESVLLFPKAADVRSVDWWQPPR